MTQSINNINQAAHKQHKFIFRSSGAWKSQTRVWAWLGSGEHSLLGCRLPASHCASCGREGGKLALWPLLTRVLISFMRAPPSQPNHLPTKPRPQNAISTYEFWGDANIQSTACSPAWSGPSLLATVLPIAQQSPVIQIFFVSRYLKFCAVLRVLAQAQPFAQKLAPSRYLALPCHPRAPPGAHSKWLHQAPVSGSSSPHST